MLNDAEMTRAWFWMVWYSDLPEDAGDDAIYELP